MSHPPASTRTSKGTMFIMAMLGLVLGTTGLATGLTMWNGEHPADAWKALLAAGSTSNNTADPEVKNKLTAIEEKLGKLPTTPAGSDELKELKNGMEKLSTTLAKLSKAPPGGLTTEEVEKITTAEVKKLLDKFDSLKPVTATELTKALEGLPKSSGSPETVAAVKELSAALGKLNLDELKTVTAALKKLTDAKPLSAEDVAKAVDTSKLAKDSDVTALVAELKKLNAKLDSSKGTLSSDEAKLLTTALGKASQQLHEAVAKLEKLPKEVAKETKVDEPKPKVEEPKAKVVDKLLEEKKVALAILFSGEFSYGSVGVDPSKLPKEVVEDPNHEFWKPEAKWWRDAKAARRASKHTTILLERAAWATEKAGKAGPGLLYYWAAKDGAKLPIGAPSKAEDEETFLKATGEWHARFALLHKHFPSAFLTKEDIAAFGLQAQADELARTSTFDANMQAASGWFETNALAGYRAYFSK